MINKKYKIILFIFLLMITFVLTGCKKNEVITNYSEMDRIIYKSVLSNSNKYLVFIYGNTCSACEELEPLIAEYATLAKNNNKKYSPLYVMNASSTRLNKGLVLEDSEYDDFRGTTNYEDIHIATTPALLVIENHKVIKYISTKVTTKPKTEIKEYISALMK